MSAAEQNGDGGPEVADVTRNQRLSGPWRALPYVSAVLTVLLSINHLFNLGFGVGYVMLNTQYLYILVGLLVPLVFILWPASRHAAQHRVPWYDVLLGLAMLAACVYCAVKSQQIVDDGWEYDAPQTAVIVSLIFWALVLEAARRAGGWAVFVIVVIVSLYPTFADQVPGPIAGVPASLTETAISHVMSSESILGIPMRAFANLVIGFLVFGVALQHTGGGKFFINLAFALLGHVRGGPAKVAIFSSGLMGSMSGSVITNVLTTGVLSIPAMRRVGFAPAHAGGVEACASTGGVLMPPIMGATAFVMATFLNVPYIDIAVAAAIPSFLYFFGLFVQIDAYAGQLQLKGLPRAELPGLRQTLKEGWHFVAVFVLLVWMLVYLKREAIAPFYATALLIVINQVFPFHRWAKRDLLNFLYDTGRLFAELAGILAGIGLIVGALSRTGMSGTIANDLIYLAGGNPLILLAMGALTSFILGIGMTVTAAYIFLAIALAPALVKGGLDPMAVHLFILYWGMLSFITPPVALGAFAAATVAGANPMRTGFQAMKLGSIIYFIPFFFVLNPALLLKGGWFEVVSAIVLVLAGTVLIAAALQGYLFGLGSLTRRPVLQWPIRGLLVVAGILIATPGGGLIPVSNLNLLIAGVVIALPALLLALVFRHRPKAAA